MIAVDCSGVGGKGAVMRRGFGGVIVVGGGGALMVIAVDGGVLVEVEATGVSVGAISLGTNLRRL